MEELSQGRLSLNTKILGADCWVTVAHHRFANEMSKHSCVLCACAVRKFRWNNHFVIPRNQIILCYVYEFCENKFNFLQLVSLIEATYDLHSTFLPSGWHFSLFGHWSSFVLSTSHSLWTPERHSVTKFGLQMEAYDGWDHVLYTPFSELRQGQAKQEPS